VVHRLQPGRPGPAARAAGRGRAPPAQPAHHQPGAALRPPDRTGPGRRLLGAVALGESLGALRGRPGSRDALAALVRKSRRVRELDELLPADGFELVPAAGEAPEAPAAEPDGFERTAPEPPAPIGDDVLHFGDELDDEPAGHEVSR
jgi:hypothetical protein